MVTLNFAAMHAQNLKLTHTLFTAATASHTTKLSARRASWVKRGEAVLAVAEYWYGEQIRQNLWQALRPQVVDSRLAAKKMTWLAQVVGMCDEFDLSSAFANNQPVQWPTQALALTQAQRQVALQHNWPKKVAAWVFASADAPEVGLDLLKARGLGQPLAEFGQLLKLGTTDQPTILRALVLSVPPFAPTPKLFHVAETASVQKAAAKAKTPEPKSVAVVPPVFLNQVLADLRQVQQHGGSRQLILPLALNLASLVNRLRQIDRLKAVELIATRITHGGLQALAPTLDQALLIDQAAVTILTPRKPMNAATQADLSELAQAGATLLTPKRRSLGANMIKLAFEHVSVMVMGSSDITASDYHTSLQLDSLWVQQGDLLANWWGEMWPHVMPLIPKTTTVVGRQSLLAHQADVLANFKAAVAQLKNRDTHARMTAWLAYQPKPPVAMTLDGQDYFALQFPQYDLIVVDTFVPNNALFYHAHGQLSEIVQAKSKQALLALGAKRAYHTDVPIGVRVRRILQSGGIK